jgi:hypothetical protein
MRAGGGSSRLPSHLFAGLVSWNGIAAQVLQGGRVTDLVSSDLPGRPRVRRAAKCLAVLALAGQGEIPEGRRGRQCWVADRQYVGLGMAVHGGLRREIIQGRSG